MAATLEDILLAPQARPAVIDDCTTLIDREVHDLSGLSGGAVKLAYKTVNGVMPGHVRHVLDSLLPSLAAALDPYWADFTTSGSAEFGDYLSKRGDEVASALLAITDARAEASGRAVVIKTYRSVRGSAARHVQAALPRVGELVQKHAS